VQLIIFAKRKPLRHALHFRRGLGWETELLVQADRLVGGSDAVLVIDDTAIAKKHE
jgi:hypothetical protein